MKVLVVFGGQSSEYEVACRSAAYVTSQIDRSKYEVHTVGVTKGGRWLYTYASPAEMADLSWETHKDNRPCVLSPDARLRGLQFVDGELMPVDVVFPVMHGKNGEDGAIAALCQMANLPQVGCSMTSGAICMDKMITKVICEKYGIPQAKWNYCFAHDIAADPEGAAEKVMEGLEYPVFVKPCSAGSSVGIGKAKDKAGLLAALKEAANHDFKVVVEAFIEGQEVEVAVLGSRFDPVVSLPGEIEPTAEFYSYDAKYNDDTSKLHIPARLEEKTIGELRVLAAKIFKILDCAGMSRVDFFVNKEGNILFNEINTIPGHTVISMYPKLMAAYGIGGKECMSALIEGALERGLE